MSREQNRGSKVQEGTGSTYQSAETFNHFYIFQKVKNLSHVYLCRQHDSLELFAEDGGDRESRNTANLKRNLGVSTWKFTRKPARQIGNLGTRKIYQNGNCSL